MYDKERVIKLIGEENWEEFDMFILGRGFEYDEDGLEIYYGDDVMDFYEALKSVGRVKYN